MTKYGPGSDPDRGAPLVRPFLHAGTGISTPEAATVAGSGVRPFLVTSGRTVGAGDIPVEAQVVVTPEGHGARPWLSFEYRDIVSMCDEPLAIAEIAARLSLHLGVIRVLVSDLQEEGMVTTYRPEADIDVETIERVISALRQRT